MLEQRRANPPAGAERREAERPAADPGEEGPPWAQGSFAPHMAAGGTVFARSAAPAGRPQGAFEDRADNSILAAKQRAETLEKLVQDGIKDVRELEQAQTETR